MLIIILISLALNAPGLIANGSESQKQVKSNTASPPATPEQQSKTKKDSNAANPLPVPVNKEPATQVQKEIPKNKSGNAYSWLWPPSGPGNAADYGMFFVTLAAVVVGLCTLIAIRDQVSANKDAAKAAQANAAAALEEATAIKMSERAYVKMSHASPGLEFIQPGGQYNVRMQVKNFGRTPARVIYVAVNVRYFTSSEMLPLGPPEIETVTTAVMAFMLPNDEFFFTQAGGIGGDQLVNAKQGNGTNCFYG